MHSQSEPLRIGFVALVDCAPLVLAHETGLFEEAGLDVELVREPGWASIRDKIVFGELEVAHAPVGFCFAINWGLGVPAVECLTGFLFNSNGDSIVISERILDGKGDLNSSEPKLKFAVPNLYSSHHFLLLQWLNPYQVKAGKDFEISVLPPSLMAPSLQAGHIDGFCVGEPFGSIAVNDKSGSFVKESAELSPMHPEKALLVSQQFAETSEEQHLKLIACLIEAAEVCDSNEGREKVATILSQTNYLDLDADTIRQSLFPGSAKLKSEDFHLFYRFGVNEPTSDRANWVVNRMRQANLIPDSVSKEDINLEAIFRSDIYQAALDLTSG